MSLSNGDFSISKIDTSQLDQRTLYKKRKFGRGHIVRQYMSSVGVITERYASDENLLYDESQYSSKDSISDTKSSQMLLTDGEESVIAVPVMNCPCYEKACKEELKKQGVFKKMLSLIKKCKLKH